MAAAQASMLKEPTGVIGQKFPFPQPLVMFSTASSSIQSAYRLGQGTSAKRRHGELHSTPLETPESREGSAARVPRRIRGEGRILASASGGEALSGPPRLSLDWLR